MSKDASLTMPQERQDIMKAKKTDRKQVGTIPVGDAARKAMRIDPKLERFFPSVSPLTYGESLPWVVDKNRPSEDKGKLLSHTVYETS